MAENENSNLESDPRFPSGDWTGFFLQYWFPGRNRTNLSLTFEDGELGGTGRDWVGPYTIEGTYDVGTGRCQWTKRYIGKHAVEYSGINDGAGIWGVWKLPQLFGLFVDRGGFHLWPKGTDVSSECDRTEQAVLTAMRQQFGAPVWRAVISMLVLGTVGTLAALLLRWSMNLQ